jgi:H/ACA ribonucleoprotein complex subunit 2
LLKKNIFASGIWQKNTSENKIYTMDVDDEVKSEAVVVNKAKKTSISTIVVPTYEERCEAVNVISQPLASKKSTKKVHKLVKKAAATKQIRRGVKEVVKGIRKGEKGVAVLAGDIYPIDVISHIPILLEEHNIPYIFVPSKFDLGAAASTKRPTSCVLIRTPKDPKSFDGQDLYDTIIKEAMEFDPTSIQLKR